MGHQLRRLALALALTFALMAASAGFWSIAQSGRLLARADNPRRLLAERRAGRGAIVDRQGALLAESVGTPGDFSRYYPYPQLAPVLGYVSPFYGTAGVEAAADATLHGDETSAAGVWDWQTAVLGAPPVGRNVRLSIDLRLQTAADQSLGAQTGAVVLLDAATGEILALASHPTYNPNTLEAEWGTLVKDSRAPLLNRATLGLYQPGGALEPMVLAAAFRAGLVQPDTPFPSATAGIELNGLKLDCQAPAAGTLSLAEAFQAGCPGPLADLGDRLGPAALDHLFADFQLYDAPAIGIPTAAAAHVPITAEVRSAAVGQDVLTITPLQLTLVTAAIARGGELPAPQLIVARQDTAGVWQPQPPGRAPISALAPEDADAVKALMPAGRSAIALTGSPGRRLAWFSGFAPLANTRYTVAVLLEGGEPADAAHMGQALLAAALTP